MKKLLALAAVASTVAMNSCDGVLESEPFSPTPPPAATIPPDPAVPMQFYFGNLHSHTGYSDGEGTPDEAFDWARYTAGYDFYAITDHAEQISSSEWSSTGNSADVKNADGQFVALRGFEWSNPEFGHINVLNTSSYTGAADTYDPDDFYAWIDNNNGLAQFNHPGREADVFQDFAYLAKAYDNFFAVETGNKGSGNNNGEYVPYFTTALGSGWRVAPTNNQDNHSLSTNSHRSVIIAAELTRAALLEAIRERRLYSSDDPNMKLTFKSDDYWMGSNIVSTPGVYSFDVTVVDDEPIAKIEFLNKAGAVLDSYVPAAGQTSASATFQVNVTAYDCFYAKVYEDDSNNDDPGYAQQITISAPIWVYPQ
ncbi:MAG: hypothetical protein GF344_09060 [Chitinivibrionales bacterium]|nr:hypothetical protein [Chitinivibrionales bacterium]MBD3357010.1 hypothetical protein [Chitinivibrionales bacterium]